MKIIKLIPIISILIITGSSFTKTIAQDDGKHSENEANQYMNRNSIESLVNAFDSPGRSEWQQPEKVIAVFGDVKGQKIMDLGAGSGYFTLRLAAKGAQVIAADVSSSFQEVISEKLENQDFKELSSNIEMRKVEYDDPKLKNEEVDGILVVNTWHHIDNRRSYMKKATTFKSSISNLPSKSTTFTGSPVGELGKSERPVAFSRAVNILPT